MPSLQNGLLRINPRIYVRGFLLRLTNRFALVGLFVANLFVTAFFWWLGSSDFLRSGNYAATLIALGRAAGLLVQLLILTQLVLVSRIPLIERAFGFDVLNRFHRRIGYGLLAGIVVHPLFLTIGYSRLAEVSLTSQFLDFVKNGEDIAKALLGIIVFIIVAGLSLPIVRNKVKYESWHAAHLLMYAAVALIFVHQTNSGDVSSGAAFYYWYLVNFSVFGAMLAYRFLYPLAVFFDERFFVEAVVPETHDVFSVHIKGRRMERFSFEPGQYIHVIFLAKGMWEPHPFSVSLAPNGEHIRISIKAVGDYTSKIKNLKPGTPVIIEGPFGRFIERSALRDKFLFIAGGIGITPIRAILESLAKTQKNAVLLYSNRAVQDIAFKDELEFLANKNANLRVSHVITDESDFPGEKGRIDKAKILRLVPDASSREAFVCGPPAMMEAIIRALKELGVPPKNIHSERFSL